MQPSPSSLPLDVPESVRSAILAMASALHATGVVRTVAVYGGVARGRFLAGRSDVNLLLVLPAADRDVLARLAATLRPVTATAVRFDPMFVTTAELPRLAAVFPIKFRDIKQHHVVVAGDPAPLAALAVPMTHARLRVEQELRNLALRSRRRFVELRAEPSALAAHLTALVRPLAIELGSLLAIDGHAVPDEDRTAAIFVAAAAAYRLDGSLLQRLAELRQGTAPASLDVEATFLGFLAVLERIAALAGGVE